MMITVALSCQTYCDYNAQIPIDMGPGSTTDEAIAILRQSDGKLIGVGSTYYIGSNHFEASLFRLNMDNTFDQTFGNNGRIGHTWDQRNTVRCAILDQEERIMTGGYQAPSNGISGFRGYVGRVTTEGAKDTTFANGGSYKFDLVGGMESLVIGLDVEADFIDQLTQGSGVAQLEFGDITAVVVTREPMGIGVFRLNSSGELDNTFSDDGYALHSISDFVWQTGFGEAHFLSDGSIIVVNKYLNGSSAYPAVAKLLPNGEMDTTFADNGIYRSPAAVPFNFAGVYADITEDEDVIIAYSSAGSPSNYHLSKIDGVTGALVTDFGIDGTVTSSASGSFNQPWDVVIRPSDGMIFSLGEGSDSNRFPTIWTVDANGNEVVHCGSDATNINALEGSQGYHAGLFDENEELRILGETGLTDTTSGDSQSLNMMIPTISTPTSIFENDLDVIAVYPNPATDRLTIVNPRNSRLDYRIYDRTGRMVISGVTARDISVDALSDGMYLLELMDERGGRSTVKFLKE